MNSRPLADLCYGVRAISAHLGIKPRQALRLVAEGRIPHFREGRIICATRSSLNAWLAQREAEALRAHA